MINIKTILKYLMLSFPLSVTKYSLK